MAATVSSVWAKPGAWALDSEEHEDELNQPIMTQPIKPDPPAADFPSLAAAAAAKPKKKNKGQTLSLAQFTTYSAPKPNRAAQEEPLVLPTGPRERTAEELERPRLGGGFRSYGGGDNSRVRVSDRGNGGGGNRERDMGPSRADEADDWSKTKKFGGGLGGGPGGGERREKGGFFNSSRADEVDNWASNKSFVAAAPVDGPRRERRMGFESYSNGSGSDSGNWSKKKEERVGGADGDTWGRRESNGVGSGSASNGNGRPKLNLQPRTLPVVRENSVSNGGGSNGGGFSVAPAEVKAKGANPFGEARPREEVLAEKGQDWKEIDEKLEAVKLKEVENGDKGEGFGRRRGFGLGRGESGDNSKTWRKPDSADAVPSPTGSRPYQLTRTPFIYDLDTIEKGVDGLVWDKKPISVRRQQRIAPTGPTQLTTAMRPPKRSQKRIEGVINNGI